MTKAELIRKLAKRSGVPDQETKIFLELFLQKASAALKRGEAVKIKGTGYFQLRQGVIKEPPGNARDNLKYADLMVFFPMQDDEINSDESLIFNVPAAKEDEFSQVDSFFSLSIGKPVIPLEGVSDTEFFSPPSGHELKKLIETKVDKLLESSEIINKYIKGNEILLIEPEKPGNDQFEFEWSEKKVEPGLPRSEKSIAAEEENRSEFEHLAWEFGDDLKKEIEEESIIDSANISDAVYDDLEEAINLEWNFGVPGQNENLGSAEDDEVTLQHPDINEAAETESAEVNEEAEETAAENFERVQSLSSVLEDNPENIKEITESEATDEDLTDEQPGPLQQSDFPESEENAEADAEIAAKPDDSEHIGSEIKKENEEINEAKSAETPEEEALSERRQEPEKLERKKHYDKKNSSVVFIIALVTIVAIGGALFLFLKNGEVNSGIEKKGLKSGGVAETSKPVVIERNYDVPVTYPYPPKQIKEESVNTAPKNTEDNSTAGSQLIKDKDQNSSSGDIPDTGDQTGAVSPKIKDYIVKTGGHYIVQVSSWQSQVAAKKAADKFTEKGYQSFVEKANVKGRGTWYRVKVGNFKTLMEAEKFFNKNQ